MTNIHINTAQVREMSQRFDQKRGDMEQLIADARRMVDRLEIDWTGNRAADFQQQCRDNSRNLTAAMQTLQYTSELLRQAVLAFEEADRPRR